MDTLRMLGACAFVLAIGASACSENTADDTTDPARHYGDYGGASSDDASEASSGDASEASSGGGSTWPNSGGTGPEAGECVPNCAEKVCGDDGCGNSCGDCAEGQGCVDGQCQCQPNCALTDQCGDDGCGSVCGTCGAGHYCAGDRSCGACESAECGVCDEIDISQIVAYYGRIGGDHAVDQLRAEVMTWPITADLAIDTSGSSPCFTLRHLDGQLWSTSSNGYSDAAAMVACWHSLGAGGIVCQSYEWYSPDWNICRSMDWPADRPVAHVLISAVDNKRTPIKYYSSWPYNNVDPDFNSADVGTSVTHRACQ